MERQTEDASRGAKRLDGVEESGKVPSSTAEIRSLKDEVHDLRARLLLVADALAALSAELKTALR